MKYIPGTFQTYIWILDLINRSDGITLDEINRRWVLHPLSNGIPMHRNTFRRYLQAIEEVFDIIIECDRHKFTYHVAASNALRRHTMKRWLLSTMSVAGLINDSMTVQKRILLENVPSGDLLLMEITRAMSNNRMLRISYQKFVDAEPYECEVEPYCIKLFRQRWYLLAHRPERDYLAMYALDRMTMANEIDTAFIIPKDFDAESYFKYIYGVFQPAKDEQPADILLRAYDGEWNYLRTLPLHRSQQEVKIRKTAAGQIAWVDFRLRLFPTLDFQLELLSKGDKVEVIEPQSLREGMKLMLEKATARYKEG